MEDQMEIESVYEQIRKDYFPRWDRKHEWRVQVVEDLHGAIGICYDESKTISIVKGSWVSHSPGLDIKLILIHEIAHAMHAGHGKGWRGRLLKAASRAYQLGDTELAQFLNDEVGRYANSQLIWTKEQIRLNIVDYIMDLYGPISKGELVFEDAIKTIGREYGSSPEDVLESFPNLRNVYDQELERRRQYHECMDRLRINHTRLTLGS